MLDAPDLFSWTPPPVPTYPHAAGFKAYGTSKEAADAITPKLGELQSAVLQWLRRQGEAGGTPDECARDLSLSLLTARPRFTELKIMGLITPLPNRRGITDCGKKSQVYRAGA
jgi:hypothetical protein